LGFPIQTRPSSESPYLAVGFIHTPSAIHCPIAKAGWLDASALFLKEISGKVIRIKKKWHYRQDGSVWISVAATKAVNKLAKRWSSYRAIVLAVTLACSSTVSSGSVWLRV
jgi:hypothetical protein